MARWLIWGWAFLLSEVSSAINPLGPTKLAQLRTAIGAQKDTIYAVTPTKRVRQRVVQVDGDPHAHLRRTPRGVAPEWQRGVSSDSGGKGRASAGSGPGEAWRDPTAKLGVMGDVMGAGSCWAGQTASQKGLYWP